MVFGGPFLNWVHPVCAQGKIVGISELDAYPLIPPGSQQDTKAKSIAAADSFGDVGGSHTGIDISGMFKDISFPQESKVKSGIMLPGIAEIDFSETDCIFCAVKVREVRKACASAPDW